MNTEAISIRIAKSLTAKPSREDIVEIADTIRKQIGRNTLMYVGANQFKASYDSDGIFLSFKASGGNLQRGGLIKVSYNYGTDEYVVRGYRNMKEIAEVKGVQFPELGATIEEITG